MLAKLFLGFTIVTLLETYLLYLMGAYTGPWTTLGLIVLTAMIGAWLTKREGLKMWREWRDALSVGQLPEEGILGGVLALVGAVLLMTPGVLTDVTGIVLLIPGPRRVVAKYLRAYLEKKFASGPSTVTKRVRVQHADGTVTERVEAHWGAGARRTPGVIDTEGEVVEVRHRNDPPARIEQGE